MMKFICNKKGFTLVELLVVIAIIGILSTVAVVNLNIAKAKARDAKRIADIAQIQKAIEVYYQYHEVYPNASPTSATECYGLTAAGGCLSSSRPGDWLRDLVSEGYFGVMPDDPINIAEAGNMSFYYYTRPTEPIADRPYLYGLYYKLEASPNVNNCWPFSPDGEDWSAVCDMTAN